MKIQDIGSEKRGQRYEKGCYYKIVQILDGLIKNQSVPFISLALKTIYSTTFSLNR